MEGSEGLRRTSAVLHWLGDVTARARVAAGVVAGVTIILIGFVVTGFPERWQFRFATLSAAITVIMVFVIQHTQSRQQLATQLKLDELVRTSAAADDHLVHIEGSKEDELAEREKEHLRHHSALRDQQ
jgi:low affinity Fe/Cu permease